MRFILLLITLCLSSFAHTHELRPASLSLEESAPGEFEVIWRVPAKGDLRLSLDIGFDQQTRALTMPTGLFAGGYYVERWKTSHPDAFLGSRIVIKGLENTLTDTLVTVRWLDGREQITRLLPDQPQMRVENKAGKKEIANMYFVLGVEHILLGIDHLLFVLALMVLVSGVRQLMITITAFTLAHSITLAAAVLGAVKLPQGPVEAVIALSIVFVAVEILHKLEGRTTLAIRKPWLVAFGFGLLHGFGFAGALSDIGVPAHEVPLSLAVFNLGVEAGQLAFITAVSLVMLTLRKLPGVHRWELRTGHTATMASALPVAYLVGGVAALWLVDRTIALVV
ncbi:HupE/UreJ family protein [Microbulbifer sp. HZ11]|uniref:HupE/UreJ family protein n=1 Tax=Microbulbifer sp. HZ11 TaxID=1453501 RepID=UPI000690C9DA|nr:HupE/UreJ family protein [Microbulbifer sp. HZ11]